VAIQVAPVTRALTLAALLVVLMAPAAAAHVQVRPATAAPEDPVLFEVLAPNERDERTIEIELAIPSGVIPFSYGDAPGWRRSLRLNQDESVRSIVWRGRLRPDGFARFAFLASTPSREGDIAWKAIQTYEDGRKVRWIGAPGSEEPAAVTTVAKRFPRQNAGGEGEGGTASAPPAATTAESDSGDGSDSTARWLAAAALVAAVASLALSLFRRRRSSST
jgi:uncharacterized protein YcnI